MKYQGYSTHFSNVISRGGGAVGQSVGPTYRRLGVRIPAAKDLSVKTGGDSSTAKRSAIGVSVTGPRRWPL